MTDINAVIERLKLEPPQYGRVTVSFADRDAILAHIKALEAALIPFAKYAAWVAANHTGWDHDDFSVGLPDGIFANSGADVLGPFRRARALLEKTP